MASLPKFEFKRWMKVSLLVIVLLLLYANRPGRNDDKSDNRNASVGGTAVSPTTTIISPPRTSIVRVPTSAGTGPFGPGATSGGTSSNGTGGQNGSGAFPGAGDGSSGGNGGSQSRVIPPGNGTAPSGGGAGNPQLPGGVATTPTTLGRGPQIPLPDGRTSTTAVVSPAIPPPSSATDPPCHPSYSGICLPFTTRVDCAVTGGPGPIYANGPFRVVGPDVYNLDPDRNGIGCG